MPWLLEFSEFSLSLSTFFISDFLFLAVESLQFRYFFTAVCRVETADGIPVLLQSRSDGPDNTRYPQDLLQYSDLRRYPVARSGSFSSIFGKGGFVYFSGLIFIGPASPRVLARYQSRAVNCTKLNILQTVSLTLLLCTVQDICIGHRLFCGHQRAQLSYLSVQGLHIVSSSSVWILQKKQILKTQKHTLLHINSSRTSS
jgi:hypothetical protein